MIVLVVDIVLGASGFVVLAMLGLLLWRRVSRLRGEVRAASERVARATAALNVANGRRARSIGAEHTR